MVAEEIKHEVVVDAPAEVVWEVLTEPEHLAWFGGAKADIDLRPGGILLFQWAEHGTFLAIVSTVEYARRLVFRWALVPDSAPAPGNSTMVQLSLATDGATTRLSVREIGFDTLAGDAAQRAQALATNREAWTAGFTALSARAAKLASSRR